MFEEYTKTMRISTGKTFSLDAHDQSVINITSAISILLSAILNIKVSIAKGQSPASGMMSFMQNILHAYYKMNGGNNTRNRKHGSGMNHK